MSFFSRRKPPETPIFQSNRPTKSRAPEALEHLIIFLGHHKVGSTSLQDYFARNMLSYAEQGILYPYVDFEGAAHFVAQNLRDVPPPQLPLNVREPHNALAFAMLAEAGARRVPEFHRNLPDLAQMRHAVGQQMAQIRPHTVVLVSEVFANFGAEAPGFAADLARLFPVRNVTLYAAFRQIDDYLVAWHGQRLKFGHKLQSLQSGGAVEYFDTIHFDYRKVLHGWQEAFPDAQLVLRSYDEVLRSGGSTQDFLTHSGLPFGAAAGTGRMNVSLHPALHEILRRGVVALPATSARRLRKLLAAKTPKLGLPPAKDVEMFGPVQRKEIIWRFSEIDRALGKLRRQDRFFSPDRNSAKQRPIPEAEARATALDRLCDDLTEETPADIRSFLFGLRAEG